MQKRMAVRDSIIGINNVPTRSFFVDTIKKAILTYERALQVVREEVFKKAT